MIGVLGFDSRRELGIVLFTTASRTPLGHTQPPIQRVQGALSLGVKWPGHEDDHTPPSRAEVKECVELYLYSPIRLHGVVLSYAQGQLHLHLRLYLYISLTKHLLFRFSINFNVKVNLSLCLIKSHAMKKCPLLKRTP
jgi:hypothetical protein